MKMTGLTKTGLCLWLLLACASPVRADEPSSTCYGTTANGSLKNGVTLPKEGKNFKPFSSLAVFLGRTYVHSAVKAIVVAAYGELAKQLSG